MNSSPVYPALIRSVQTRRIAVAVFLLITVAILLPTLLTTPALAVDSLRIDPDRKEIRIAAVAHPGRFQGPLTRLAGMPVYHFLVTTPVDDRTLHVALVHLGAIPGNTLKMDAWESRNNPNSASPDKRIEGSPVQISPLWQGRSEPVPLVSLLKDPGGKGFNFRFGGHEANIPIWKSGCVACLYSCPGAKIDNAAYTVRNYVEKRTAFRIRQDHFPPEGTPVTLTFRLAKLPTGEKE